jgi:uncharacterized protein YeaO (DUF488 family)
VVIGRYFGNNKQVAKDYLEKRDEEFTLWRLQHYSGADIKYESERGIEKAKEKKEAWLEKIAQQQELRENDEWADWEYVHALFQYFVSEEMLDPEINDVYDIFYSHEHYSTLHYFELYDTEWSICKESDADELAKERVKELIDDIGVEAVRPGFVDQYIDGEQVVEDMDFDSDVRDNPECYLDETEDRELSEEQIEEIQTKRNEIETLEQEQQELDVDTPEGEERYEEIQSAISDLESEIEDIEGNPEGDWKEDKIEEVIQAKKDEVENDPAEYLKGMGFDKKAIAKYVDKDELAQGVIDSDGRGPQMSSYDGNEIDFQWEGVDYCIYRTN